MVHDINIGDVLQYKRVCSEGILCRPCGLAHAVDVHLQYVVHGISH